MTARKYIKQQEEILYTLEEAEKILYERKKKLHKKKLRTMLYYAKQKISGIVFIIIGIILPFVFNGDISASIFCIPTGIWLIFTKKEVMEFK